MAKKERFQAVQSLRFICFMMVFVAHSTIEISFTGVWALEIFFMLSGFMMVYSYADRDLPSTPWGCVKFGYKRTGKLYPLHVETALLQLCMIVPAIMSYMRLVGVDYTLGQTLGHYALPLAANLALVQDWVPDIQNYVFSFNGPSWFLSAMVFSYALFPWIMRALKKLKTTGNVVFTCLVLALAAGLVTWRVGVYTGYTGDLFVWTTQHCPAMRCIDFFMGCALGWLFLEHRRKQAMLPEEEKPKVSVVKWTILEVLAIGLVVLQERYLLLLGTDDFCQVLYWCRQFIPVLLTGPILMVFVLNRGYITKALCWKPLVYLGNISMYMYLIHYIFTNAWAMKETAEGWANELSVGGQWGIAALQLALTILCSIGYDKLQKYKARRKQEKLAAKVSA